MTTIHRTQFPVRDELVLTLPGYRRAIHAQLLRRHIAQRLGVANPWIEVWYETEGDNPIDVRFYVEGTGHQFTHQAQHVATFQDGALIWHVYVEYPLAENLVPEVK